MAKFPDIKTISSIYLANGKTFIVPEATEQDLQQIKKWKKYLSREGIGGWELARVLEKVIENESLFQAAWFLKLKDTPQDVMDYISWPVENIYRRVLDKPPSENVIKLVDFICTISRGRNTDVVGYWERSFAAGNECLDNYLLERFGGTSGFFSRAVSKGNELLFNRIMDEYPDFIKEITGTALMETFKHGHMDFAQRLFDFDPSLKDNAESIKAATSYARDMSQLEVLVKNGAKIEDIACKLAIRAAQFNELEMLKAFIDEYDVDPNVFDAGVMKVIFDNRSVKMLELMKNIGAPLDSMLKGILSKKSDKEFLDGLRQIFVPIAAKKNKASWVLESTSAVSKTIISDRSTVQALYDFDLGIIATAVKWHKVDGAQASNIEKMEGLKGDKNLYEAVKQFKTLGGDQTFVEGKGFDVVAAPSKLVELKVQKGQSV